MGIQVLNADKLKKTPKLSKTSKYLLWEVAQGSIQNELNQTFVRQSKTFIIEKNLKMKY
jgi:predicted transposase YdaD